MKQWTACFVRLYESALALMTSLMFVVVGANVFCRYILNNSLGWVDELARFLFIWISFGGAVLAYNQKEHVGLDFVVERISNLRIRRWVMLISSCLELVVISCLFYYGWIFANSATNVSAALYIPMKFIYMVVPLCSGIMLVINLKRVAAQVLILIKQNADGIVPGDGG